MKDKGARNIAKVKSAEATMQLLTNVKLVDFGFACKFPQGPAAILESGFRIQAVTP